ncbi:P-loop NTPase fold protein [Cereibacter sp. SYSU M97828]|nr:P-loop NTPase fold protein [Cereibacter flavus]
MWSDTESSIDYLNYSEVSEMLVDIISDDDMLPTSIGVYGSWGVGKSSLLRLTGMGLQDEKYLVVEFDAWLYQDFDEAKSALMTVIAQHLYDATPEDRKEQAASFFRRVNKLKAIGIALDLGALAMGVPTMGALTKGAGALQNFWAGDGDVEDFADVRNGAAEAQQRLGGLLSEREQRSPPAEIAAFREEFAGLLRALDRRLVVFVDNLDRCLPVNTIATMEAMRLFLFLPKTAFVVAADEDMIRHAVSKHFDEPGSRHVTDYLDKLINIPVRVPKLGLQEVRAYLFMLAAVKAKADGDKVEELRRALIEKLRRSWSNDAPVKVEEVSKILGIRVGDPLRRTLDTMDTIAGQLAYAERVQGNPRIVKRLLNVIRMRSAVATRRRMPFDDALIAKLALFERCTDGEAIKAFGQLVNSSQNGTVTKFAELEGIAGEEDLEALLPKEWAKHRTFVADWLKLKPPLTGVDLRAAVYLSRETLPVKTTMRGLSAETLEAIDVLRKTGSMKSPASKAALKKIDFLDAEDAMEELCAGMSRNADWSKIRPDFRGAVMLAGVSGDAHARLVRFIENLPDRPPWMAGLMKGLEEN